MNIFNEVDRFFSSLSNYIQYNEVFIIFLALFILTIFIVIISTSNAYEAKLIKAIDMFNNYFIDNPQINEENLVAFNNKMKSRKVPKQLRKQWQQFVLYREDKASHYMSFDICVSTPIKNSSYKRDITVMNIISYILALVALIFNLYISYETTELALILQRTLLCPVLILVLNFVITIFLDLRHNAIVSDLYQNYQYFEVNIDKATQTLPEYVDYEVLFDRNEIKKGIPILYAYLQKRAEEEQRELERARLKNVEHEKFNFDEAGVESSLVLERAMQEAENYIAERKKYMQDIEQINADITQEEMNFREITKEYQRQMQVSKESFDNFKSQLEEVSSTIEANYLKKQQQQELDRQRNLEKDYDTATDRHKKLLENYQAELTSVENSIKQARQTLERGMMSEFSSYSNKVYDEAMSVVEQREQEKTDELKNQIKQLEEKIVAKDQELDNIYNQNQQLMERLDQSGQTMSGANYQEPQQYEDQQPNVQPEYTEPQPEESVQEPVYEEQLDQQGQQVEPQEEPVYDDNAEQQIEEQPEVTDSAEVETIPEANEEVNENEGIDDNIVNSQDIFTIKEDESKPVKKAGRPRKTNVEEKPKRKVGRPKKERTDDELDKPKRPRGRPKKAETTDEAVDSQPAQPQASEEAPKRRGRPRKENTDSNQTEEVTNAMEDTTKKRRGRPKKVAVEANQATNQDESQPKRRGRPKKAETQPAAVASTASEPETKKKRGRPKKVVEETTQESDQGTSQPKRRGRPRKVDNALDVKEPKITDIDAYLKEIDDEIAKESAKLEKTTKELEEKAKINKKK
ncbi:MAG TPA: hypothetical protein IAC46_00315 [Candidatus Onthoplasma faecigallinarum]|nr:hypothetical protein [Candidatus Onthoplasma faecigallinarum]